MPRIDIQDIPDMAVDHQWVVIVKDKKATYKYLLLDSGIAHVFKSEDAIEPAYEIKDGICSCPAAYHSKLCKHVKTVQRMVVG